MTAAIAGLFSSAKLRRSPNNSPGIRVPLSELLGLSGTQLARSHTGQQQQTNTSHGIG